MAAFTSTRRPALALALLLVSFGGISAAWSASRDTDTDVDTESSEPPPPAQTAEAALLMRLGLDAEMLCAAGVQSTGVAGVVDAVFAEEASQTRTQREIDVAYGTARTTCDSLRRTVRSGLGTAADVDALADAKSALAVAEGNRATYLDALRNAGLGELSASVSADLSKMVANREWRLPTEFLLDDRTEQEWVDLRDALAAERIDTKAGEVVPGSVVTALATARAGTKAATAKVCLDTYMVSVQTAWNAAATR
jgi:hypothetical protein